MIAISFLWARRFPAGGGGEQVVVSSVGLALAGGRATLPTDVILRPITISMKQKLKVSLGSVRAERTENLDRR